LRHSGSAVAWVGDQRAGVEAHDVLRSLALDDAACIAANVISARAAIPQQRAGAAITKCRAHRDGQLISFSVQTHHLKRSKIVLAYADCDWTILVHQYLCADTVAPFVTCNECAGCAEASKLGRVGVGRTAATSGAGKQAEFFCAKAGRPDITADAVPDQG